MIAFLANLFGYVLNFFYNIFQNYGIAIIVFSILIKILMLPLSIKQQRSMEKSAKMQGKIKEIQTKYKNDQEKINTEMMNLYKKENMSPFSGCLSSIAQILILFAVFYLVRSPLTYMKKIDSATVQNYTSEITASEENNNKKIAYPEIAIIKELSAEHEEVNINMEFLGLDLSSVPTSNYRDIKVYVIPVLYVISSIVSMKLTTNLQKRNKDKSKGKDLIVINDKEKADEDPMEQMNKSMIMMGPLMSVSISLIAPLGLALYWLVNNVLMIIERLVLNKLSEKKDNKED